MEFWEIFIFLFVIHFSLLSTHSKSILPFERFFYLFVVANINFIWYFPSISTREDCLRNEVIKNQGFFFSFSRLIFKKDAHFLLKKIDVNSTFVINSWFLSEKRYSTVNSWKFILLLYIISVENYVTAIVTFHSRGLPSK